MRAAQLRLEDLFEVDSTGGIFRFAGERVVLLDAVALGLLRTQLVQDFGERVARGILTRLGYSHGWRIAEAIRETLPWDDQHEWQSAGGRLHRLKGMVRFEPVQDAQRKGPEPLADALWFDSYEAEQHLTHLGQSKEPVCWSLCGFASGYLSAATGKDVYCIEESCVGCGDSVCRMLGRTREEWGEEIEPHLPFYEKDCLEASLRSLRDEIKQTEARLRATKKKLKEKTKDTDPSGLIAQSQAMQQVLQLAQRTATVDTPILIYGETGVGKERIAQLIHDRSPRQAGPFVAINCAALPDQLLESELFGFDEGAFTGASHARAGLFEAAQGGTLFLDEIGEISPALQVRLLRVLQERKVRRLGENHDRPVDIRILSATHRDLHQAVQAGHFREDLLYRLRVIELHIPPLRERADDILPLARAKLKEAAQRFQRDVTDFTPAVARQLLRYTWPGNVRELQNAMERAVVFAEETCIDLHDMPEEIEQAKTKTLPTLPTIKPPSWDTTSRTQQTLAEIEKEHILAVLHHTQNNKTEAAKRLGIGIATLFRKLKAYQEETLQEP
ncbi:MAG: sigma 54-interacting transcriptional regulator [Myxococcales bacterium]|nr:sigma 54-interacting transcriptional regulator [Myxococcales bacterium]